MYHKGRQFGYEMYDLMDGRALVELLRAMEMMESVEFPELLKFAAGAICAISEANDLSTKYEASEV